MKKAMIALLVFALATAVGAQAPLLKKGESVVLWEGFEGATAKWTPDKESGKDSGLSAAVSTDFASEGKQSLMGKFKMNGKDGATFLTNSIKDKNWSAYKGFALDVKNGSDKELEMAFAVKTGDTWEWQESATVKLKAGAVVKDIRFDFYTNKLKSDKTGWQTTGSLRDGNSIQTFILKFFGPKDTEGAVYIDNIRFIK